LFPVKLEVIDAVKKEIKVPLIVGGRIKSEDQKQKTYNDGADMAVMGSAFEK
jgi:putative glycerol-1-phosphate prenyltransferase